MSADASPDRSPDSARRAPPFGVVINHFAGKGALAHLSASTLFAASLAARDPLVAEVLVVDGSPTRDEHLRGEIERIGARYHHEGRPLGFAEAYNLGARRVQAPWIVLSASDVYASLTFFQQAARLIDGVGEEAIGCIIPRLTAADLPIQESSLRPWKTCTVPLMTLNINVFERKFFFDIGAVPEAYSGGFNDVDMSLEIRRRGRRIFLLADRCVHYGSLTLAAGGSFYRYSKDQDTFAGRHPEFVRNGEFWDLDLARLTTGPSRHLLRLARLIRSPERRLRMTKRILRAWPLVERGRQ